MISVKYAIKTVLKYTLKSVILYVHLVTRTSVLYLFYLVTLLGLFGEQSALSNTCFFIFVISVILNHALVVIFNTAILEKKATDLVGRDFAEKWLSH